MNNPFRRRQKERAAVKAKRARALMERHRREDETRMPKRTTDYLGSTGDWTFAFGKGPARPYFVDGSDDG